MALAIRERITENAQPLLEPGETIQMRVFEVDGVRIVVTIHEPAEVDAAVHAELYQIVDSIRLAPPL